MSGSPRRRLGAAYADEVGPDHVGRRVTIRHVVVEDGRDRPTDVVGRLRAWGPDGVLVVERRDGQHVQVAAQAVVASRLLPEPPARRR